MTLRRYDECVVPGGVGYREESTHPGSGLRIATISVLLRELPTEISGAAAPIGTSSAADVTAWTAPAWGAFNGRLTIPQTPVVRITQSSPAANKKVRIRMSGTDQFGSAIMEITPWVDLSATIDATQFPMSKVFAWVARVEYQSIGIDSDDDEITVGLSNLFDPTFADDNPGVGTPISMLFSQNLGIGLPVRMSPYGRASNPPDLGRQIPDWQVTRLAAYNITQSADLGANIDAMALLDPFYLAVSGGVTVGLSASGWQGSPHKFGVHKNDGWISKFPTRAKAGAPGVAFRFGGEAEGVSPRADDTLKLSLFVRSRLGTRYDAHGATVRMGQNAVNSYPYG